MTALQISPLSVLPQIRALGRHRGRNPLPLFWTASGAELLFTGSELWFQLECDYTEIEPWVSIELNGAWIARQALTPGRNRVCAFRGMTPGTPKHVRLLNDVQPMQQDPTHFLQLNAVEYAGGEFLPLPEPQYRLEFVGDSITSDQVSGIGTMAAHRLNAQEVLNAACGYATCSDWHEGDRNITPVTLIEPPNTNTADNVLSNQVRRVLQALTPKGSIIRWTVDGVEYAIPAEIGIGTGTLSTPDVIYIAISSNDGNQPENAPADDFAAVCELPYAALTRTSMASALLWAVRTLQTVCPNAAIFLATPLQTYTPQAWMDESHGLLKRSVIQKVAQKTGVHCIDSFYGSGFDRSVARSHGEVHPDEEWKIRIADFVTKEIESTLYKE